MKSAIPAVVVAAVTLWTAGASAQGRNFAGSWTIDSERTAAAAGASAGGEVAAGGAMAVRSAGGGGGGGRGGAVAGGGGGGAVASGGGGGMASGGAVAATGGGGGGARGGRGGAAPGPMTINIDASSFTLGSGTTTTAYKLDGSTTTIQTARGDVTAKAAWKGDKLVIETTSAGPDGPIVTTTSWYLDGDALVREMSTPSAGGTPSVRKTYFKKA